MDFGLLLLVVGGFFAIAKYLFGEFDTADMSARHDDDDYLEDRSDMYHPSLHDGECFLSED